MSLQTKCRKNFGFFAYCLILVLTFCLALPQEAEAKTKHHHKKKARRPAAARVVPVDRTTARYADLILEADTGRILQETNSTGLRHPASLTKMMTLYVTFQALESGVVRLETQLPVSAEAAGQSPTKLGLRAGQRLRVYDAIMSLITESANDAAVVLAEGLAGSVPEFVNLMNRQAKALGMRSTTFQNPSGLPDPDQVTNARDMATLALALVTHYPGFYPYFSRQSFTYAGRVHHNHNHLMERYDGMDGIKTGYIRTSGFNLVASASRGGTRVIGVIFGGKSAPTRDNQMEGLLDDAFAALNKEARGGSPAAGNSALALPSKVAAAFPPRGRGATAVSARKTTPEAPPPAAPPAEDDGPQGAWGIQIGAFSDVGTAQQALANSARNMSPVLDRAEQSVQKITVADGSAMFRARFTGLDQIAARAACTKLIQHGQGCLVVSGP